jgi:hypothetical protein
MMVSAVAVMSAVDVAAAAAAAGGSKRRRLRCGDQECGGCLWRTLICTQAVVLAARTRAETPVA